MSELKLIFEALVPENIKNIPLMKDAIDIFLTNLEENAAISIDINNLYNQSVDLRTDNISQKANINLRKALLEIYIQSIYNVIKLAQANPDIRKKLVLANKGDATILNVSPENIIGSEFFATNKNFKESVGTVQSITQAHALANMLESNPDSANKTLKIIPSSKFNLIVESVLTNNMYSAIVEPLSHPVGFTYSYIQIVELSLLDFFGIHNEYTATAIEIRGSAGTFEIFTPLVGEVATDAVWTNFKSRTNILTGNLFTLQEFQTLVIIHTNKSVQNIIETITDRGRELAIFFTDGTAIIQNPGSSIAVNVLYVIYDTWILSNGTGGIIKSFAPSSLGHFSIFADYTSVAVFDYYDNITNLLVSFNISELNDTTGNPGGITYTDSYGAQQPIDTSDHIIMTSPTYAQDTFAGVAWTFTGTYMVSNTSNTYFTTSDPFGGYYLVVS